jgi:hypothetical protein
MLSREYGFWNRRLAEVLDELGKQKQLVMRMGRPVVLHTSALMEGKPFATFDWHALDPSLVGVPVRLYRADTGCRGAGRPAARPERR